MKKAIVYLGIFAYDMANSFAREIGHGLTAIGYDVTYLDLGNPIDGTMALTPEPYRDVELIISIAAIRPTEAFSKLLQHAAPNCKLVAVMIDPPILFRHRLAMEFNIFTFIDRSHLRSREYLEATAAEWHFLPHGGSRADIEPMPWEQRPHQVIFAGTWSNPDKCLEPIMAMNENIRHITLEAVDLLMANNNIGPLDAMLTILHRYNLEPKEHQELRELLFYCHNPLDGYIRARKRFEALTILDRAGLAVDIWGKHWPDNLFKHHRLHGEVPSKEINRLMAQSQFVLDLGWYPDGGHERIFSAMRNGAIAIAGNNNFLAENFSDQEILFYNFTEFAALPDKINTLLSQPQTAATIAAAGSRKAENHHTWENRATRIAEIALDAPMAATP